MPIESVNVLLRARARGCKPLTRFHFLSVNMSDMDFARVSVVASFEFGEPAVPLKSFIPS